MFICSTFNARMIAARIKADGVQYPRPDYLLLFMIWSSPFVAFGLLLYGCTVYYHIHKRYWIVAILGTSDVIRSLFCDGDSHICASIRTCFLFFGFF